MIISKEYIDELKKAGNGELKAIMKKNNDNKNILFVLENLGYIPNKFDDSWIIDLLKKQNNNIRFWAVKTLGKTKKEQNIPFLEEIAFNDKSTEIRREAVSSIGRVRTDNKDDDCTRRGDRRRSRDNEYTGEPAEARSFRTTFAGGESGRAIIRR